MFLVAEVEDFGKPKLSSQSNVTIHLSTNHDPSENSGTIPQFMSSQYEVMVEENVAIGTCLIQVSATVVKPITVYISLQTHLVHTGFTN